MVDVIVDHSVAARRDLAGFLDALIYNWVVAAPGGHAKNHSLLLDEQSATLAPLCDLISYLPYRKGTKADQLTIAMRVGRDYTLRKHDRPSAWKAAAFYDTRPQTGAVVHLHSRHSVAWSMMPDVDPENALPPLTPYSIMQLGRVKLLPFFVPGDPAVGEAVRRLAGRRSAVLLANHGPVVAGEDFESASNAIEELEYTAELAMLTLGHPVKLLSDDQVQSVVQGFDIDWDG